MMYGLHHTTSCMMLGKGVSRHSYLNLEFRREKSLFKKNLLKQINAKNRHNGA